MKTKLITLLVAILSVGILYAQSDMDGIKLNDIPTYTIKTSSSTGGTATTSLNEVVTGGSVTLNAYANSGYGFKNWTVNGTVVSAYNPYTVTPTGNTTYKANFVPIKSGLYMGIMGFNKELNNKNIGILTSDTKSSFTNFVNNLTTQKGTILYYAVENAIDSLATATLPGDLESVIMITFTDGLDQGSFMMNNKYETIDEYLTVLNNKIKNTKVQRLPINAYSIGLKGSDVVDDVQFQNNLTNLASSPENAIEVSSMDEVNTKLQEIATAIYQEKNGETIKLTILGQSPNTKIRFTFDNVTDASKSQFYIEGTFSNDYSLKNVVYSGMTSKSGLIVAGETDGFEVTYTFKDIEVTNVLYDRLPTSNLKQWSYVTSSSKWQKNSEFSPEESSIIKIRPTVIMLVLDCSSSLGSQFTTMKTYANNFIKKIEEGPKYYTVSASANTGGTAVASSENVREGGNVRLTAIPNDGYKFKNWTKNGSVVSTSNPDTVTITANSTFVANFEIAPTYTVKVSANTGGTAVASSENMWEGGSVILTATPKSGYKFKNWTSNGSVVSTSNPYIATITANSNFVANFEKTTYYKVRVGADIGGTAVASSENMWEGGSVTLTATPNSGYKFKNWSRNGSVLSTSNPYTTTITATNNFFYANFEIPTYTVEVSANTGGTATASAYSVQYGGSVTLTATPDSGYKFKNWTLNGNVVSTNWYYYATITANSHFVANFYKSTGHEYVDLGLSVKWADCNVGATSPEGYGDYFAWGETSPKEIYNWDSSYKWDDSDYYSNKNNKTKLDLKDDAAYVNWGGNWRMPTKEEFQELIDNCTWTESTLSGVNGVIVTSKINGNSIFLPKPGHRSGPDYVKKGSVGRYWSSSLGVERDNYGCHLWFMFYTPYMDETLRYYGLTIRAVYDINNTAIEEINTNSAFVYAGNGVIYINNHIGNVKVIGVSGQVVKDVYIDGNDTLEVTPGLYIVKTGNKVTKIVVK